MIEQNPGVFLFDDIRVEPGTFRVFKAGETIQLEPKTFRLLIFLIANQGRLVEKEELLDTVWDGAHVTENALTREIAKLRKTLGDDSKSPKYVQTVHTRGYRFIAELRELDEGNGRVTQVTPFSQAADAAVAEAGRESAVAQGRPESLRAESFPQPADINDSLSASLPRSKQGQTSWVSPATIAIAGVLMVGLVAGIVWWKRHRETALSQPPPSTTSVAVLPFKASGEGGEGDDAYLGVEIADSLTTRLGASKRLSVLPMTTVLHFVDGANPKPDLTTIGNLLKVDYVLYGEIDKSRQRVSTKLIRVRDGASLFADNSEEKLDNLFQLEDSLSAKVLVNLLVNLDHEETQRLRKRYTENPQAYEAFLKAHYFMNLATKEDTYKGIDYFRQAIELDPKYAMAYAGLSDCYMRLSRYGTTPMEFVPRSRAAAMKAVELDDTVAYSHSMLGRIAFQYDWDFARAESEYARARQLEPSLVHGWYASFLMTRNRMSEAEAEYRKFEDFLPFLPMNINLGEYLYFTRQYDQAVDFFTRKLEMNPDYPPSHEWLGLVYEQQGRTRQAIEEFQKAIQLSNGERGLGALGHIYAVSGKKDEARKAIKDLESLSKRIYVSSYQKAVIYAGLGEKDQSFGYLQKSFDERSMSGPLLRFDPRLNELRGDPRFHDLMRRAGMMN